MREYNRLLDEQDEHRAQEPTCPRAAEKKINTSQGAPNPEGPGIEQKSIAAFGMEKFERSIVD